MNGIPDFALVGALIAFPALAEDIQVFQNDRPFSRRPSLPNPATKLCSRTRTSSRTT